MKKLPSRISKILLAGLLGITCSCTFPVQEIHAINIGNILGTVIGGAEAYREIDEYMNYVNNTEQGRHEYFEKLKEKEGVSEDYYHINVLDGIMSRLTAGIAASDPSIYDKPYLYFLNKNKEFNAACGLGHVMTVNEGIFDISDNIDEVAVILAHEMGHGQKDHVLKGTRKKVISSIGASVVAGAIGGTQLANIAMGTLVEQINSVQITKKAEWEADNLSFEYCYQSGYNPGAGAALWQRILEKQGEFKKNLIGEIFSPSDHPTHHQRRDNYEKHLTELSGKHVTIKKDTDIVQINNQDFVTPAPLANMSSTERKYFVMGNLAAAYDHGQNTRRAYVSDGTVMLGNQPIITPVRGDPSASELAALLNRIK